MVAWPVSLPQSPQFEGNSVAVEDNRVVFKADAGPVMMRQRTTGRNDQVTFTFLMTRTQLNTFMTFYETDLANGTKEFTYLDPTIAATRTFIFVNPPNYSYIKPLYVSVQCVLRRLA